MESFSTNRMALLPRAANWATLVVVVSATWWSSAQRPVEQAAQAPGAAAQRTATALPLPHAADLAEVDTSAGWPVQANVAARGGLQSVGYQARTTR